MVSVSEGGRTFSPAILGCPHVGSGKLDAGVHLGSAFAVETRGPGAVDSCGMDEKLPGAGFSGEEA